MQLFDQHLFRCELSWWDIAQCRVRSFVVVGVSPFAAALLALLEERHRCQLGAVITDQGPGFDWHSIMNGTSENGKRTQGRGISRARLMSFDRIAFNDAGNRVIAFMRDTDELDW